MGALPRTAEGQVAVPPTAAEMGRTVREEMAAALEAIGVCDAVYEHHNERPRERHNRKRCRRCAALDRHRAEPEEPCTAACDQPTEAHCVDHCGCYEAGHQAGLEAQRERVGGGTA